jgi:hypothetical protein
MLVVQASGEIYYEFIVWWARVDRQRLHADQVEKWAPGADLFAAGPIVRDLDMNNNQMITSFSASPFYR